jgi:hypothetical protein
MRIEIHGPESITTDQACDLRAVLFNDGYEPVGISRNAFIGPSVQARAPSDYAQPASVEPTYGHADEPMTLQPFTFYGRERTFTGLPAGELEVTAAYSPEGSPSIVVSRRIMVVAPAS